MNWEFNNRKDEEFDAVIELYEEMVAKQESCFFEESVLEQILDYYEREEQIEKALGVADMAIAQYPYSGYFMIKKASLLYEDYQIDEAIEMLDKAEMLDPHDLNIYLIRSDIYTWQLEHHRAIDVLYQAIDIADSDEDIAEIYLEMADVYEDWEKYDKLMDCLEETLRYFPDNEEALSRLWYCVEMLHEYDRSVKFHTWLVDEKPYSYLAWFNLAHAYQGLKNYEDAIESYEFAIAINDTYEYAYRDCGEVLMKTGNYHKAAEYLIQASVLGYRCEENYFNIGLCFEHLGEYKRARYYFRKAVQMDNSNAKAFFRIGENYRKEQRWEYALKPFEKAVFLDSKNIKYLSAVAEAYVKTGNLQAAIHTYEKARALDPARKKVWINLADVYFQSGEYRKVIALLDEAIKVFKNDSKIYFLKSAYNYQIGQRYVALLNLEKGLTVKPSNHKMIYEITPFMRNDPAVKILIEKYRKNKV